MSFCRITKRHAVVLSLGLCASLLFGQSNVVGMDDEVPELSPVLPDLPTEPSVEEGEEKAQPPLTSVRIVIPPPAEGEDVTSDPQPGAEQAMDAEAGSQWVRVPGQRISKVSLDDLEERKTNPANPLALPAEEEEASAIPVTKPKVLQVSMASKQKCRVEDVEATDEAPERVEPKKTEEKPTEAVSLPVKDNVADLPVRKRAGTMLAAPTPVRQPRADTIETVEPEAADKPKTAPSQVLEDPRERPPHVDATLPPVVPKMVRKSVQRLDQQGISPKADETSDLDPALRKTDVATDTLADELNSVVGMDVVEKVDHPAAADKVDPAPAIGNVPTSTEDATRKLNAQLPAPAPQRVEPTRASSAEVLFDDMEAPAPLK